MEALISPQRSSAPAAQNEGATDSDSCGSVESNQTNDDDVPYFGDRPLKHTEKVFRILSANVDNLPFKTDDEKGKNVELFKRIKEMHGDCVLMQEVGLNWSLLSRKNSWKARVEQSLEGYKHCLLYTSPSPRD